MIIFLYVYVCVQWCIWCNLQNHTKTFALVEWDAILRKLGLQHKDCVILRDHLDSLGVTKSATKPSVYYLFVGFKMFHILDFILDKFKNFQCSLALQSIFNWQSVALLGHLRHHITSYSILQYFSNQQVTSGASLLIFQRQRVLLSAGFSMTIRVEWAQLLLSRRFYLHYIPWLWRNVWRFQAYITKRVPNFNTNPNQKTMAAEKGTAANPGPTPGQVANDLNMPMEKRRVSLATVSATCLGMLRHPYVTMW